MLGKYELLVCKTYDNKSNKLLTCVYNLLKKVGYSGVKWEKYSYFSTK